MVLERLGQWSLNDDVLFILLGVFLQLEEFRCVLYLRLDVQDHREEQRAGKERNPPTPAQERFVGNGRGGDEEDQVAQHYTERDTHLTESA